jgi:transcriptional regulator with XRE-family HTH domain
MSRIRVNPAKLRELIMAKKMTITKAAEFLDMKPSTLSRLTSNDICSVNIETARKLNEKFGSAVFEKEGDNFLVQDFTLPPQTIFKVIKKDKGSRREFNDTLNATIEQVEKAGYILTDVYVHDKDSLLKFERKKVE